jgi:CO/xanthine dehydrogenase FAD-binding subunit
LKPAPFVYEAPDSLDAALTVLAAYADDAKVLAGGQSLLPVLNFRLAQPARLIDLNRVPELAFVRHDDDGSLRLGAMTRQKTLERDPRIGQHVPLLAEAAPWIAHPQIRNRGTVGGSLAHADPAAELPALAIALDARFLLRSTSGERWVDAKEFYVGLFATALAPDELLVEIDLPPQPAGGWAFLEEARRHGDYAQVGVAALLGLDAQGEVSHARLVYLSAGDTPIDAASAAALLVGQRPTAEAFAAAAHEAAEHAVQPVDDIHASAAFKRHLTRVLTKRALAIALARASAKAPTPSLS